SNSLIRFPLFFILKKGKKLRPIINYKKLNKIIKKNYYFYYLLLSLEIYFIKLTSLLL
ncbi:hypothetical protein CPAR01_00945, partial [Colletotrichum paranaense]